MGDLDFAKPHQKIEVKKIIDSLYGEIYFIMGNHDDYKDIVKLNRFKGVYDYLELKVIDENSQKHEFYCMHYPIYSWNKSHHGSKHLHGHCHGNLHHGESADYYVNRRVMDVGCMLHNYTPISYSEVINKLDSIEIKSLKNRTDVE